MKTRNLLFIAAIALFMFFMPGKSSAQTYNQAVSANPLGLVFDIFNVTYEHKLSQTNSFTVNGYYWGVENWNAYGFGGSYRWYIDAFKDGKTSLEGFSVGPAVAIGFWSFDGPSYMDYGDSFGGTSIAIGGEAAYKWVWDGFMLEPSISIMFNASKVDGYNDYNAFGLGLSAGYAW